MITLQGLDIDLDALLDSQIKSDELGRKRTFGHFWATDMGKCRRQVYYSFTHPKSYPASSRRTFRIGTIIHNSIQSMLKAQEGKQFREVWNEKYVMVTDTQTDLNITGKIDTVLVPFSADEPPIVLEFKSENERSFSQRNSVPYNHKCQMTIYLRSQRLPFGYVVYINKSNMELHPLKVVFSDKLFDALMQSARDIYWHLKNSKLPNKTTIKWECNFCLWKDECAENCNDALHKRLFPAKQQGGLPASQESAVQESVVDGVA